MQNYKLIFRAQLFYFMGEVESVFGIWFFLGALVATLIDGAAFMLLH